MKKNNKKKILFVCMGNICRSPTAHGVFEDLVTRKNLQAQFEIDSAGTHAYHVGEPPDRRSQQTATTRGLDLSYIQARQVTNRDFDYYDIILAMDQDNMSLLTQACPELQRHKLHLFLEFAPEHPLDEVPDPYYGGANGFEDVFDMVQAASEGLLVYLTK